MTRNGTTVDLLLKSSRIIGVSAAIIIIIFQVILLCAKPYSGPDIMPRETYIEVAIMVITAILAAYGALKLNPILLSIASLVSFSSTGQYSLRVLFVHEATQLCSFLYMATALTILIQKKKIEAARIIGLSAAILTIILYGVLLFTNPYSEQGPNEGTYRVVALMIFMALLAVWGSLKFKPLLLFIAFFGSFIPEGFYMLGTPGIAKLIGICNLLFLVAGIVLFIQRRKQKNL